MISLNPEQAEKLAKVLQRACLYFSPTGQLTEAKRQQLAQRILALVQAGEWDEWRLARGAVAYVGFREKISEVVSERQAKGHQSPRRHNEAHRVSNQAVSAPTLSRPFAAARSDISVTPAHELGMGERCSASS